MVTVTELNRGFDFDGEDVTNVGALNAELVSTENAQVTGGSTITINVPSDESSFSDAIFRAASEVPNGERTVIVYIESGHAIETGIDVTGVDLSFIEIQSADATVPLGAGFPADADVMRGEYASLPRLNTQIDMGGAGRNGINVHGNAWARNGSGVINAGEHGIQLRGGTARLDESNFSGATERAYLITQSASARMANADATNSGDGVFVSRGASCYAIGADASGCDNLGFRCHRGLLNCEDGTADNCTTALDVSHSIIAGDNFSADGSSAAGVEWRYGATGSLRGASITNSTDNGVNVTEAASVNLHNADVSNNLFGINATFQAQVDAAFTTINGNSNAAVRIDGGSTITVKSATVDGAAIAVGDVSGISSFNAVSSDGIVFN